MGTGMIIIAAILFAIILVPIVLLIQSTKNKSRILLRGLEAATFNNSVITEHTEERNFAIGLDAQNNIFYFFKTFNNKETTQVAELSKMKSCNLVKKTKQIKTDKGSYEIVESIALRFMPIKGSYVLTIELYNDNENLQLNGELVVAETYVKKIKEILKKPNAVKTVQDEKNIEVAIA
ncbi:hypothetical protein SCB49_09285 [unidentified eubacterium SCB49]|nr:hypothetical protein SCB49_09285 [unidentified eubacterium SCB49]